MLPIHSGPGTEEFEFGEEWRLEMPGRCGKCCNVLERLCRHSLFPFSLFASIFVLSCDVYTLGRVSPRRNTMFTLASYHVFPSIVWLPNNAWFIIPPQRTSSSSSPFLCTYVTNHISPSTHMRFPHFLISLCPWYPRVAHRCFSFRVGRHASVCSLFTSSNVEIAIFSHIFHIYTLPSPLCKVGLRYLGFQKNRRPNNYSK